MDIQINLSKIEIKVARTKGGDILGFAEVKFFGEDDIVFIVRGYTIKMKPWGLSVNAPAYHTKLTKSGLMTSFAVEPKKFWQKLKEGILKEYETTPEPKGNEDVDPSEIPDYVGKEKEYQ